MAKLAASPAFHQGAVFHLVLSGLTYKTCRLLPLIENPPIVRTQGDSVWEPKGVTISIFSDLYLILFDSIPNPISIKRFGGRLDEVSIPFKIKFDILVRDFSGPEFHNHIDYIGFNRRFNSPFPP